MILWFGLFDDELYIEHGESRYGPYRPIGGPIPLHRYRRFKKTRTEERAERVVALAKLLTLPRAALKDRPELAAPLSAFELRSEPFTDPDPYRPSRAAAEGAARGDLRS